MMIISNHVSLFAAPTTVAIALQLCMKSRKLSSLTSSPRPQALLATSLSWAFCSQEPGDEATQLVKPAGVLLGQVTKMETTRYSH